MEPLPTERRDLRPLLPRRPRADSTLPVSPTAPRSLPSPILPVPYAYPSSMTKHERSMVERLGQQRRQPSADLSRSATIHLPPIEEQTSLTARLDTMTVNSPPLPGPPSQSDHSRRQSMAAEARSVLLSGLPESEASGLVSRVPRRHSTPNLEIQKPFRRGHNILQQLHAQSRLYYGNARTADIFVAPVQLRRPNNSPDADKDVKQERQQDQPPAQLVLRARVRPRTPERQPFVIERTFELETLRSTAVAPVTAAAAFAARRQSAEASSRTPRPSVPRQRATSLVDGRPTRPASGTSLSGNNAIPMRRYIPEAVSGPSMALGSGRPTCPTSWSTSRTS